MITLNRKWQAVFGAVVCIFVSRAEEMATTKSGAVFTVVDYQKVVAQNGAACLRVHVGRSDTEPNLLYVFAGPMQEGVQRFTVPLKTGRNVIPLDRYVDARATELSFQVLAKYSGMLVFGDEGDAVRVTLKGYDAYNNVHVGPAADRVSQALASMPADVRQNIRSDLQLHEETKDGSRLQNAAKGAATAVVLSSMDPLPAL